MFINPDDFGALQQDRGVGALDQRLAQRRKIGALSRTPSYQPQGLSKMQIFGALLSELGGAMGGQWQPGSAMGMMSGLQQMNDQDAWRQYQVQRAGVEDERQVERDVLDARYREAQIAALDPSNPSNKPHVSSVQDTDEGIFAIMSDGSKINTGLKPKTEVKQSNGIFYANIGGQFVPIVDPTTMGSQAGEMEAAKGLAANEPKVTAQKKSAIATADRMLETIDQAISETGNMTAGIGSVLSNVPGTPARGLAGLLSTLRSNVGFGQLQEMRNNSPTGGAVGQLSDNELKLLADTIASIDQGQDPDTLRANLAKIRGFFEMVQQEAAQSIGVSPQNNQILTPTVQRPSPGVVDYNDLD